MLSVDFNISVVIYIFLVLVRISTIVFILPVFGANLVPAPWKIAFSLVLSVVAFLIVPPPDGFYFEATTQNLFVSAAREALLGLLIGITTGLIFSAVLLGGQVIGTQMGLAISNVFDPQHQANVSVVASFYYLLATVLFLSVNGHHLVLYGIRDSFVFFPAGRFSLPMDGMMGLVNLSSKVFVVAVQLASALMVMLLLVSISLGIISRTVPQMNIFIIGFPLQLLVGLFGLVITIPFITKALVQLFERIPNDLLVIFGKV
ncbi:MAG: flagellar biosynthetic protein FliR [Candidatus Latescibacteria bacterium 4484_7]|nr:MAG: flagellar biosynthetic protein FliR [Candidatus Latescibacteria bacterium 4484_7]